MARLKSEKVHLAEFYIDPLSIKCTLLACYSVNNLKDFELPLKP